MASRLTIFDRFQTYFPHIDNVYSHRSTQKYKRKPFVSHYWDCRMKGRPPGTAKSEDPTKKKRKRQARERDLCDVKIKITEYFPGARRILGEDAPPPPPSETAMNNNNTNDNFFSTAQTCNMIQGHPQSRQFPFIAPSDGSVANDGTLRLNNPNAESRRFYTVQRVNGNGANGKNDGNAGSHKHSLEDSDRIKKNSVLRHMLKAEKDRKKSEVCVTSISWRLIAAMLLWWRTLARSYTSNRRGKLRMLACQASSVPPLFPNGLRSLYGHCVTCIANGFNSSQV